MEQQKAHFGWTLKKEIQLTHIFSTISLVAAAVFYVNAIERRIVIVEQQIAQQKERDAQQDTRAVAQDAAIQGRLDRIESKLDRLIERYQGVKN